MIDTQEEINRAKTILVVDDNAEMLSATVRLLSQRGYHIVSAEDAAGAIQAAQEHRPDVILLDVVLPDGNGIDVCRRIREDLQLDSTYVILMSGLRRDVDTRAAALQDVGADAYLVRPVSNTELVAQVAVGVRIKQDEDRLRQQAETLAQRVAELDCLYAISELTHRSDMLLPDLLQQVADRLALALDHPEHCAVRIVVDGTEHLTRPLCRGRVWHERELVVKGKVVGRLELLAGAGSEENVVVQAEEGSHTYRLAGAVAEQLVRLLELQRDQQSLRREHALLERIVELSPVGMTVVNQSGDIVFANSTAEEVLGLSKSQIEGLAYDAPDWRITDLQGTPIPSKLLPFAQVMATGEPVQRFRHAVQLPSGHRVALSISGSPIKDGHGQVNGVVFSLEDITLQVEEEAQSEERLGRELRSLEPMSSLKGQTPVAGRLFGREPLRTAFPAAWQSLVQSYSQVVGLAVDEKVYGARSEVSARLRGIAQEIGRLRAGPRDVVDIHVEALKSEYLTANPLKSKAYAEEGRLVVLELMGYVTAFYRDRMILEHTSGGTADVQRADKHEGATPHD
jgi:PAS domain S-box-containing protein